MAVRQVRDLGGDDVHETSSDQDVKGPPGDAGRAHPTDPGRRHPRGQRAAPTESRTVDRVRAGAPLDARAAKST